MHVSRRSAVKFTAAALAGALLPRGVAAAAEDAPLKLAILSASTEYKSHETLGALADELEKNHRVQCSRIFGKDGGNDALPGLEALDAADVMLVFTRRLKLPADQLDRVKKYCDSGRPVVGVRTASHAFQDWLEFDKLVLGGNYQNHFKVGPTIQVQIEPKAKSHPILAGVEPFTSPSSLYKNSPIAADAELLLTGTTTDGTQPLAWTRSYKGARVFYVSLGSPEDFANAQFRRLLTNGIFWSAQRDPAKMKK